MSEYLGLPYEKPLDSLLSSRISHTNLLLHLGNDAVGTASVAPKNTPTINNADGTTTNEYGMIFKPKGLHNEFYKYPLGHAESEADIENYKFPDPFADGRYSNVEHKIAAYKNAYGVIADLETAIFETSWYLTGLGSAQI